MDQSRYWLWSRTKLGGMPHLPPLAAAAGTDTAASYEDSLEEQAFAEDSAGHLGGCVWPPRSYSCSFCRREFRSAQALGGHMNVHRRDRARLRLSSPSNHIENGFLPHHQQQHPPNPCSTPLAVQFLPQVYSNTPNPSTDPTAAAAPPPSPSRVSVASTRENYGEHTLVSPSYSSSKEKKNQKTPILSITRLDSDPFSLRIHVPELKLGTQSQKLKEMDYGKKRDGCFEEEVAIGTKRRRIDVTIPFISVGSSPSEEGPLQSEVPGLGPTPIEELDLELRLGDRPKIK